MKTKFNIFIICFSLILISFAVKADFLKGVEAFNANEINIREKQIINILNLVFI
jgi:hypothetical protein